MLLVEPGFFKPAVLTTSTTIKPDDPELEDDADDGSASPKSLNNLNLVVDINSEGLLSENNLDLESDIAMELNSEVDDQIISDLDSSSDVIDKDKATEISDSDAIIISNNWFQQQLSSLDKWWNDDKEVVEDESVNDRDESGKIMNVQGQKRNPKPRPGSGSSRPQTIVLNSAYEIDHDPYYSNQHMHYNSYPAPVVALPPKQVYYKDPQFDDHVDRQMSQLINKILQYFLHSFQRSDPIHDYESDFKEVSVSASYSSDDNCGGGYLSWSLCMIGL